MTDYIIGNSLRCGKSIKYNRVSKEKALDVYKGEILPQKKTLLKPLICRDDCHHYVGRYELSKKTNGQICVNYKNDENGAHRGILYDYKWCVSYMTVNGVGKIFINFVI